MSTAADRKSSYAGARSVTKSSSLFHTLLFTFLMDAADVWKCCCQCFCSKPLIFLKRMFRTIRVTDRVASYADYRNETAIGRKTRAQLVPTTVSSSIKIGREEETAVIWPCVVGRLIERIGSRVRALVIDCGTSISDRLASNKKKCTKENPSGATDARSLESVQV